MRANLATRPDGSVGPRCFDPAHLSYSASHAFDECEYRAHATADLGVAPVMGPPAAVGSAVHDAIATLLAGGDPDVAGLLDAAADELAPGATWDRGPLAEKAGRLVALWRAEVAPVLAPTYAAELELHFALGPRTAHVHIDWVGTDGTILDWKASGRRLGDGRANDDPQLTWYWLALREVYGARAPGVGLVGLIDANPPKDVLLGAAVAGRPAPVRPWLDWQRSTRSDAQADALIEEIARREEARTWARRTGIYLTQGRASPFACPGCPVRPICPAWAGYSLPETRDEEGAA